MLFEHVAPSFDDIQQSLFEGSGIHAEPCVKDLCSFHFIHFRIKLFIRVDLANINIKKITVSVKFEYEKPVRLSQKN